jgi:hypothetical protein
MYYNEGELKAKCFHVILRLFNDAEVMIMNDKDDTAVKEVKSL